MTLNSVYLSFLGLGSKQPSGDYQYNPTVYELSGKRSGKTEFVQVAEIEILGADNFDKFIIISTQRSFQAHFSNLKTQLIAKGAEYFSLFGITAFAAFADFRNYD